MAGVHGFSLTSPPWSRVGVARLSGEPLPQRANPRLIRGRAAAARRSSERRAAAPALVSLLLVALVALAIPLSAKGMFPSHGIVVPGQSIGNVRLGMSETQVRALWGS